MVGFQDQLHQVSTVSTIGVGISWSSSKDLSSSIQPAISQAKELGDQRNSVAEEIILSSLHISKRDSSVYWHSQRCCSGNTTSSPILQIPPENQASLSKDGGGKMNALVHLSESDREELNWWIHQANLWSLLTPPHTLMITTDASMWGWGAACQLGRRLQRKPATT